MQNLSAEPHQSSDGGEAGWKGSEIVLVIDGSPRQHHGVVVSPLGRVAPPLFAAVPEVAAGRIANDAIWETLPHCEGKIHLGQKK